MYPHHIINTCNGVGGVFLRRASINVMRCSSRASEDAKLLLQVFQQRLQFLMSGCALEDTISALL
jgi:hypothetical protein